MRSLESQVEDSLTTERLLAFLSGLFGGLALLLAMVGLYGVLSYMVTRRTGEIGIRMALGANRGSVQWLVLREMLIVAACGTAAGLLAAVWTSSVAGKFLFGVKPNDPVTLTGAVLLLLAVAAIAGYVPARRASRLEPIVALREE
jgi:ABC-type antimicrobial peptide transport system permease subunit